MYRLLQEPDENAIRQHVSTVIADLVASHGMSKYLVLFLYDDAGSIESFHANQLYEIAAQANRNKDILLVLQSGGASIEPAYLISKTLKRLSHEKFVVAVPRRAKSAATLIALGADEIHMGLMSQLGPIDPQLGGLPALAVSNAMDALADLVARFPAASEMVSKYLSANLALRLLGYYQRVGESAVQYAERLLANKKLPDGHTPNGAANHLVNHYKVHDFVIDVDEARWLLGDMIREGTPEYTFVDEVFKFLDFFALFADVFRGQQFFYVGGVQPGPLLRKKQNT